MSSFSRSLTAAPRAGRAAAHRYGLASAARGGGMTAAFPSFLPSFPSPACSCGGSSLSATLLPLQIHRSASRSSGPRSPTVRRLEKKAPPRAAGPRTVDGVEYTMFPEDLGPLIQVFPAAIQTLKAGLTTEEIVEVLSAMRLILRDRLQVTEESLLQDYNITPYKLHMVALVVLTSLGTLPAELAVTRRSMLYAMLYMASTVAGAPGAVYMPSVLTSLSVYAGYIDRTRSGTGGVSEPRNSFVYRHAESAFLKYLARENSASASTVNGSVDDLVVRANAFTIAGRMAETAGDPLRAIRWYKAAQETGWEIKALCGDGGPGDGEPDDVTKLADVQAWIKKRQPRWDWEFACLESLGELQMEAVRATGKPSSAMSRVERETITKAATVALLTAALVLGSTRASMCLAKLYTAADRGELSEQEAKMLDGVLLLSAQDAMPEAVDLLAKREAERVQAIDDKAEKAFRSVMAGEWERLSIALKGLEPRVAS